MAKPIDTLTFFHQATVRICGSLDIDKAVLDCAEYLKRHIPLSNILLGTFDKEKGAVVILAMTDRDVEAWGKPIPLSAEARDWLESSAAGVSLFTVPHTHPVGREVNAALGIRGGSEIVMHLRVDETQLGVVSAFSRKGGRFTEEHVRLMGLLHDPFAVALANVLRHKEILRLKDMLADDNTYLQQELRHIAGDEIVGDRYGLRNVMDMVRQVAPLDSPVLLTGETGVGKELVANAIHFTSSRREGPLVKVNCGAFVDNLLDSELFGHEKGAFTGAVRSKRGRFERADGGTLFLDELGELPPGAQVRLLRVLQDGIIERVGGTDPIKVNVRIVSATNRNLEEMVRQGRFREDLLFRLNVFPIHIPPLRERKSDIPALVHHFMDRKFKKFNFPEHPVLAPGAMESLMDYPWPGNVRELENIVERTLIWHQGAQSTPLRFDSLVKRRPAAPAPAPPESDSRPLPLDEAMRRHIEEAIRYAGGRIQGRNGAAALLGLHPSTLRSRMAKLGIPFPRAAT